MTYTIYTYIYNNCICHVYSIIYYDAQFKTFFLEQKDIILKLVYIYIQCNNSELILRGLNNTSPP